MKHILEVKVTIVELDENGETTTDLSSPTIDLAIEKMGAWAQEFYRQREQEVNQEQEGGDSEKASDLQTDGVKIEE